MGYDYQCRTSWTSRTPICEYQLVKSCWKYETSHLRLASIKFWPLWLHSLSLLGVQTDVHWSENLTTQISNGKSAVGINSSKPQAEPFSWVSQENHSWMSEALCPLHMECRAPEICVHDWFTHLVSHFQFVYKYCRVVLVGIIYRSSLITSFRCLVDTAEHWFVGRKVIGSTTDSLQTFGGHSFAGTPKRHLGGDGAWVPYHGNPRRAEWTLKATLKILEFCLYLVCLYLVSPRSRHGCTEILIFLLKWLKWLKWLELVDL